MRRVGAGGWGEEAAEEREADSPNWSLAVADVISDVTRRRQQQQE